MQEARRTSTEVNDSGRNKSDPIDTKELENKIMPILSEHLGVHSTDESESDDNVDDNVYFSAEEENDAEDPKARILSANELERTFIRNAPDLSGVESASTVFFFSLPVELHIYQILPVNLLSDWLVIQTSASPAP